MRGIAPPAGRGPGRHLVARLLTGRRGAGGSSASAGGWAGLPAPAEGFRREAEAGSGRAAARALASSVGAARPPPGTAGRRPGRGGAVGAPRARGARIGTPECSEGAAIGAEGQR